jgi:hypothetical protein
MLPNDAKLKDLRERVIDAAANERNGLLIIPAGVLLVGLGLIFSVIGSSGIAYFGGLLISALGFFSTLLGFYVTAHYAHQYNDLLKELEHTL